MKAKPALWFGRSRKRSRTDERIFRAWITDTMCAITGQDSRWKDGQFAKLSEQLAPVQVLCIGRSECSL